MERKLDPINHAFNRMFASDAMPAETTTTIDRDREFDQTARTAPPQHVSPAIHEYRVQRLKQELKFERIEHAKTQDRLAAAESRIRGFEKMSAALSKHADELMIQFERITGRTPEQMLEIAAAELEPAGAAA